MTLDVQPPHDDEETTRHKFYVAITAALDNNTAAMNAIGDKLDSIAKKNESVTDDFREFKTSIESSSKTLDKMVKVLSSIFGGLFIMLATQTYGYIARIEALERKAADYEIIFKAHVTLPEQVQAIKNRLSEDESILQNHIDSERILINAKKKENQ